MKDFSITPIDISGSRVFPKEGTLLHDLLSKEPRIIAIEGYGLTSIVPDKKSHWLDDEYIQCFVPTKQALYVSNGLPSLSHEISHWLEMMDESRWNLIDWGQGTRTYIASMHRNSPIAIRRCFRFAIRELRVRSIELYFRSEKIVDTSDDCFDRFIRMIQGLVPFGRFKTKDDVKTWGHHIINSTFSAWSEERIRHEFDLRLASLRNWMETTEVRKHKKCRGCLTDMRFPSNFPKKKPSYCSSQCYDNCHLRLSPEPYQCLQCKVKFMLSPKEKDSRFCSHACKKLWLAYIPADFIQKHMVSNTKRT